jgi:hypothetical protein
LRDEFLFVNKAHHPQVLAEQRRFTVAADGEHLAHELVEVRHARILRRGIQRAEQRGQARPHV